MREHGSVGKRIPVVQAIGKATGSALFGGDIRRPGMLTGKILRSPLPHARIKSIDTSKAERLPGVKAVVTGKDIPRVQIGSWIKDRTVLAFDKVRHVGDPMAAVAAIDEETAGEALELIDVEYEELPAVTDPRTGMGEDAPLVHENLSRTNYPRRRRDRQCGLRRHWRQSHQSPHYSGESAPSFARRRLTRIES